MADDLFKATCDLASILTEVRGEEDWEAAQTADRLAPGLVGGVGSERGLDPGFVLLHLFSPRTSTSRWFC